MQLPIEILLTIAAICCRNVIAMPGSQLQPRAAATTTTPAVRIIVPHHKILPIIGPSSATSTTVSVCDAACKATASSGCDGPHCKAAATTTSACTTDRSGNCVTSTSSGCISNSVGDCESTTTSPRCISIRGGSCAGGTTAAASTSTTTSECVPLKGGGCATAAASSTTSSVCVRQKRGDCESTTTTASSACIPMLGASCSGSTADVPATSSTTSAAAATSSSSAAATSSSSAAATSSTCSPQTLYELTTSCLSYCPGQLTATVFGTANITLTETVTLTLNSSVVFPQATASLSTPILPCTTTETVATTSFHISIHLTQFTPTTTVLLTSKLTVTSVTVQAPPDFSGPAAGTKSPVGPVGDVGGTTAETGGPVSIPNGDPNQSTPTQNPPLQPVQPGNPVIGIAEPTHTSGQPATVTVGTVPVIIGPTGVIINSQTFDNAPGKTPVVTVGGQTFTVNPSQVIGNGVTFVRPPAPAPATPTPTVIAGVPILAGPSSVAVVGGTTFTIGPNTPQTSVVVNGQTVGIGPSGIVVGTSTFAPSQIFPSPAPVVNGGAVPTVEIINGQTTTIGSVDNGNPSATAVLTEAGITFSDIGGTQAVIGSQTFNIGTGASPTTVVVNGQTISLGPGGIGFSSTTITPGPITTDSGQAMTMDGIAFTEYGSTIAVIGGNTYNIGPGAWAVTQIIGGNTWSIGPSGVAMITSTSSSSSSSSTSTSAKASPTKKSEAHRWGGWSWAAWASCAAAGIWTAL